MFLVCAVLVVMMMGISGFGLWFYYIWHSPTSWMKPLIGMGFGACFGCSMVHWVKDIISAWRYR